MERPSFFGITPAPVLFHPKLKDFSVRLFPVISTLCNTDGYCTATNKKLAEWLNVAPIKITRALADLESHGFINVELTKKGGTYRKIYLCISRTEGIVKIDKGATQNCVGGLLKNDKGGYSNLSIQKNNTSINNTSINSRQTDSQSKKYNPSLTMVSGSAEIHKHYPTEKLKELAEQMLGRSFKSEIVEAARQAFIQKYDWEHKPIFTQDKLQSQLIHWVARQRANTKPKAKPKSDGTGTLSRDVDIVASEWDKVLNNQNQW